MKMGQVMHIERQTLSADLEGRKGRTAPAQPRPKFLHFRAVFGKKLLKVDAPSGKSKPATELVELSRDNEVYESKTPTQ